MPFMNLVAYHAFLHQRK